jgi:hypothetical protein
MDKVVISLDLSEAQELQRILLDEDATEAFEYLRNCIAPKVAVYTEARRCKPTFEWGTTEPALLKHLKKKNE